MRLLLLLWLMKLQLLLLLLLLSHNDLGCDRSRISIEIPVLTRTWIRTKTAREGSKLAVAEPRREACTSAMIQSNGAREDAG